MLVSNHMAYISAMFEVAASIRLGGDAFTSNVADRCISAWTAVPTSMCFVVILFMRSCIKW